jgi:hypothetical protein
LQRLAEWWTGLDKPQREGVGIGAVLLFAIAAWIAIATTMHPTWQPLALYGISALIVLASTGLGFILPQDHRQRARVAVGTLIGVVLLLSFLDYAAVQPLPENKNSPSSSSSADSRAVALLTRPSPRQRHAFPLRTASASPRVVHAATPVPQERPPIVVIATMPAATVRPIPTPHPATARPTAMPSPTPLAVTFSQITAQMSPNPSESGQPVTYHFRVGYETHNDAGAEVLFTSCTVYSFLPGNTDPLDAANIVRGRFSVERSKTCTWNVIPLPPGDKGTAWVYESNISSDMNDSLKRRTLVLYYAGEMRLHVASDKERIIPICGSTFGDPEVYHCLQRHP